MYPYVRIALILLFVGLALSAAALAGPIVSGNLVVRRSWERTQALVFGMVSDNSVEVSFGGHADEPRVSQELRRRALLGRKSASRCLVLATPDEQPNQNDIAGA